MGKLKSKIDILRDELDLILPEIKQDKLNILIIDDETKNLKSFKGLFRREFNVITATNLDEAVFSVKNNKIDFVFCDYLLKDNTGAEILEEIVSLKPNIKRACLTAFDTEIHRLELLNKSNTRHVLNKPARFNEIMNVMINYNNPVYQ